MKDQACVGAGQHQNTKLAPEDPIGKWDTLQCQGHSGGTGPHNGMIKA